MQFEWDESKRQATLRERGIDFIDAAMVWDDPMRQERVDSRKQHGETRIQTIGRVHFGILFVVYTERVQEDGEEAIRIISVMKANKRDRDEHGSSEARGQVLQNHTIVQDLTLILH